MILTNDQAKALDSIGRWMKNPGQWMFFLAGYAGTGKTTLIQHFINSLSKSPICLAPTGKAASVLQRKLSTSVVTTIHKALYTPMIEDANKLMALLMSLKATPNSEEIKEQIAEERERLKRIKLRFQDSSTITITAEDLVIVDEASMVTNKMVDDLKKLGCKVLFVGDVGQLPPVGDNGFFSTAHPDASLEEIVRQAADNPIIRWSMKVRKGEYIPQNFVDGTVTKMPQKGFPIDMFLDRDQILTGTNKMRHRLNRSIRKLKGFVNNGDLPEAGEHLICLKNGYKFGCFFVNGIQCLSTGVADVNNIGDYAMDILWEGTPLKGLPFYEYPFRVHYDKDAQAEPWQMRNHLIELDYAYAITVHKSQGSEWEKVALVDDDLFHNDVRFRRRWLYTAITRAKGELLWLGS